MAADQPAGEPPPPPPSNPPPPAEGTGSSSQRWVPTPFLTKTYQLVEDPAVDDVISWNEDGSAFVVWRPAEFARDILPTYFKHNNFSSFVRQLNTYGFRKSVPDRWEFANDCFRRGERRLLCDIHRRKVVTPSSAAATGVLTVAAVVSPVCSGEDQVIMSSSPSPEPPTPQPSGDQNVLLRRENARLERELGHMKKLCNNIFLLMSKYAGTQKLGICSTGEESVEAPPPPSILELMPPCLGGDGLGTTEEDEMSARLFGVSIGRKRMRGEEPSRHPAPEEPMDAQPPDHGHRKEEQTQAWPIYRPTPVRAGNGPGSHHDGSNPRIEPQLTSPVPLWSV